MTAPRIGPGVGSFADQIEALDQELLEVAGEAGALRRENSRLLKRHDALSEQHDALRERLVGMTAEVQGLKVALQSKGLIEAPSPVPAASSERGLYLAWSAS